MHSRNRIERFALVASCSLLLLTAVVPCGNAAEFRLNPSLSIVDYLKSQGRESGLAARQQLFVKHFPNEDYTTGTAEQNTKLLIALVDEDSAAHTKAANAEAAAVKIASQLRKDSRVEFHKACPAYVLAEGFGVLGSYGFTVSVSYGARDGRIDAQDFQVLFNSPATSLGQTMLTGTVRVYRSDKLIDQFALSEPWFETIGRPDSIDRYLPKGKSIDLAGVEPLKAVVELTPIVKTDNGAVPLWSCTATVDLRN